MQGGEYFDFQSVLLSVIYGIYEKNFMTEKELHEQ